LAGPVAFAPDGRLLAATESGAPGILVDTTDRAAPVVLSSNPGPSGTPGDAVFYREILAMAGLGVVTVWDVTEPAEATRLTDFDTGETGMITGRMAVSPPGVLATAELGDLPNRAYARLVAGERVPARARRSSASAGGTRARAIGCRTARSCR
jgi:hypothetical protein